MAQEKSGAIKGIIAIAVIIVCIVVIVAYQRSRKSNAPAPIKMVTIDIESGELVEVIKQPGQKFPLTNPATGNKTLFIAYVDRERKYLFPGRGMVTMSPTGSSNVGALDITDEEYKKYPIDMSHFRR